MGVAARCASDVEESRRERLFSSDCSTREKGRYLLGLSGILGLRVRPFTVWPVVEPFVVSKVGWGVGYSHSARCVCEAITATSFPFPEARCAFMKTKRLAMQDERGSLEER